MKRAATTSTRRCCAAACSSRCTCTPATATCTPTSRSTPTTTPCCRRPTRRSRASWRSRAALGGVISGEHGIGITKLEYLTDDELAPFAAYKQRVDPRGPLQPRQAAARPALPPTCRRLHAELLADRPREPDPRAERHRRHRRFDQGLPALRQVQAGVRDARAARQPAVQPAQQDPRHVAADRGVPVRGADAARRQPAALRRVRRRRRPLHGLPQVREPVPGGHRLRRRVDRDAQPAAPRGQAASSIPAPRRRCSSSTRPIPATIKLAQDGDDRLGLQGAAPGASHRARRPGWCRRRRGIRRATVGKPPLKAQVIHFINKPMPGGLPKRTSRALLDIEDDAIVPIIRDPREGRPTTPTPCSISPAAARSGCSRRWGSRRRRCSIHVGAQTVLPPGYLCCGYPQTSAGNARRGPADHDGQPRAVPSRGQHAQLPRHQDGDRVLRHLHGPAAEIRVRQDLPRLPPARHPRVPDGEGRARSRASTGDALHVPRPLPHADEDLRAARGRQRADGHAGAR